MRDVMDLIISRMGDPVRVHFPEYQFLCPFCESRAGSPDTRGHLYVNGESGYFCHRCEARGRTQWLLRVLGVSEDEVESHAPAVATLRYIVDEARQRRPRGQPMSPVQPVEWPDSISAVWDVPDVWAYAQSRGLSRFECDYYGLRAWTDDRGRYRLLFPDFLADGTLVYWTARAVANGVSPKYQAAQDSEKSHCVWNLQRVRPDYPIYVAEGVMSARACGRNGVAIYGKHLSDIQLSMITRRAGPAGVRIVMDGEARKSTFRGVEKFLRSGVPCGAVILPVGKDPDEMHSRELTDLLLASNPLTDTGFVRLKKDLVG